MPAMNRLELRNATRARLVIETHSGRQALDGLGGSAVCTASEPWSPERSQTATHPDAEEVGEQWSGWPAGDWQRYRCPHRETTFNVELPQ